VLRPLDSLFDPLPDAFALRLRVLPRDWLSPLLDDWPDAPRLLERLEEPRPRVADISTSCCSSPTSSERHELREQVSKRLPKVEHDANLSGQMFYPGFEPGINE
jgi:hypothetical protein